MARTYVGGPQHGKQQKGKLAADYRPFTVVMSTLPPHGQREILLHSSVPEKDAVAQLMDADPSIEPEPEPVAAE